MVEPSRPAWMAVQTAVYHPAERSYSDPTPPVSGAEQNRTALGSASLAAPLWPWSAFERTNGGRQGKHDTGAVSSARLPYSNPPAYLLGSGVYASRRPGVSDDALSGARCGRTCRKHSCGHRTEPRAPPAPQSMRLLDHSAHWRPKSKPESAPVQLHRRPQGSRGHARTHQPAEPVCRIVGVGAGSDAVTAEAACDDAQCACAPCDTRDAATASGETTACNRSAQQ